MICSKSDPDSALIVSEALKKGLVAILPTDTVYGFSAIVDFPGEPEFQTEKKIREIKGRSETKPFIQLIASPDDILRFSDEKIPDSLKKLWPGPLTVIVSVKAGGTVAFRCPGDKWLRDVIELCNRPVYSTSVNRSGCPVLTSVDEIRREFGDEVDLIVDDGDSQSSVPSTIVKIENGEIIVVRQGAVKI
ncbi:MAG: L-threonylcarbamoyladenylate synthase [Treponema sp.]|nr:L-threonylcarbamoyladenylate synthase [Treponema sp.]